MAISKKRMSASVSRPKRKTSLPPLMKEGEYIFIRPYAAKRIIDKAEFRDMVRVGRMVNSINHLIDYMRSERPDGNVHKGKEHRLVFMAAAYIHESVKLMRNLNKKAEKDDSLYADIREFLAGFDSRTEKIVKTCRNEAFHFDYESRCVNGALKVTSTDQPVPLLSKHFLDGEVGSCHFVLSDSLENIFLFDELILPGQSEVDLLNEIREKTASLVFEIGRIGKEFIVLTIHRLNLLRW